MQSVLEKNYSKPKVVTEPLKVNGGPKSFRWTVSEYYQMADLGFFHGRRVQLIKEEIIEMAPMKSPHATSIQLVNESLRKIFLKGFEVCSQLPVSFSKIDEPEPNIDVVEGSIRDL